MKEEKNVGGNIKNEVNLVLKNLLGGESNPGQPGDSRLYLTTILPKITY